MLIEVEGIINSRPLTYIYDDVLEPLTPSHLLSGRNLSSKSGEIMTMVESSAGTLNKRLKYLEVTMQDFWNRFQHAYLSELREHHTYNKRKTKDNSLEVGNAVIIKDDNVRPRNAWRMGRVESLVVGRDDKVRGANLITLSKEGKRTKISSPCKKSFRWK